MSKRMRLWKPADADRSDPKKEETMHVVVITRDSDLCFSLNVVGPPNELRLLADSMETDDDALALWRAYGTGEETKNISQSDLEASLRFMSGLDLSDLSVRVSKFDDPTDCNRELKDRPPHLFQVWREY